MKYKAGDVVRVRKDILVNKRYGAWTFVEGMRRFIGNCVTINEALDGSYKIREDSCYITDEMLEDVEDEFRLPEKWYVIVNTPEEAAVYRSFFSNKTTLKWDYDLGYKYGWNGRSFDAGCGTGLLITLDQFKKYVLKSGTTPSKEEVKFEAGKWYKGEPNNYYFKAAGGLKDDDFGNKEVPVKEMIAEGRYKVVSYGWTNPDYIKFALENPVDLSEIQQYLPEGHPDKFTSEKQSRESLLEEAKRRYPVGTRFISAFLGCDIYTVDKPLYFIWRKADVVVNAENGPSIYSNGKWAEIVESPKVTEEIRPDLSKAVIPPVQSLFLRDGMYVVGVDPIDNESSKNKGESKSLTNESDFPIISTKRIINFSQLT